MKPIRTVVSTTLRAACFALMLACPATAQDSPPSIKQDTPPAPAQMQETRREALRVVPDHQGFKDEDLALPSSGPKAAAPAPETVAPKNEQPGSSEDGK